MTAERDYWNERYATGGDSGWCSIGKLRDWRWKIINKHVDLKDKSVLDVGCGDLRFWAESEHDAYVGLDISQVIIEQNRVLRPEWYFIRVNAAEDYLYFDVDVVFCFEMLFHVMTEKDLKGILSNMNQWARELIFISCWSELPGPFVYPHYQCHWQLEEYFDCLPDFRLKKRYTTRKGLRGLYVFERVK